MCCSVDSSRCTCVCGNRFFVSDSARHKDTKLSDGAFEMCELSESTAFCSCAFSRCSVSMVSLSLVCVCTIKNRVSPHTNGCSCRMLYLLQCVQGACGSHQFCLWCASHKHSRRQRARRDGGRKCHSLIQSVLQCAAALALRSFLRSLLFLLRELRCRGQLCGRRYKDVRGHVSQPLRCRCKGHGGRLQLMR